MSLPSRSPGLPVTLPPEIVTLERLSVTVAKTWNTRSIWLASMIVWLALAPMMVRMPVVSVMSVSPVADASSRFQQWPG